MHRALPLLVGLLGACGAPPPRVAPARLDVLQHIYLRGTHGENVGLTFDGLGPCASDLLGRLKQPAEGRTPLRATFFVDPADPPDGALTARLEAEGHEVALWVPSVPADWKASPEALRRGLTERMGALAQVLSQRGWRGAVPRFWRPGGVPDPFTLGRTADAERPVVLWSVYGEGATAAEMAERVLPRLAAGEILAVPTSAPECPAVALVPDLAKALGTTRQAALPVGELLASALARHHPPQVVRYHGPGLSVGCAQALGRPPEADATQLRPRWGLVHFATSTGVQVLPVGGVGDSTAAVLDGAALALWADRPRWLAMPGCLHRIGPSRVLSPVAAGEHPIRWWAVGDEGLVERDARAAASPNGPAILPATPDLVRLEARQRLPWPLRGLVADALERLSLDTPLLVEARVVAAVVVGRPLSPQASPQEVEAALGAFTQVVELSLAEYMYLAMSNPADLAQLQRVARAADGFLRPGPFLVLRHHGLNGDRLGPDGTGFPQATAAVQRVLAAGHALAPGDIVSALPSPLLGAPVVGLADDRRSRRARLRHGLARSILAGSSRSGYLRPGAVLRVEGDLLGVQEVRIAVPAGVAVPSPDAGPLRPAGGPTGVP